MAKNPTKEQFLKNPRAKELRQVCLDIAQATDNLLHKPNVVEADEYATIEQRNGRLIELGITPHFKAGLGQSAYEDPLTMAEYVAGQWMDALSINVPSESSIVPIVLEHSEASSGPAHVISSKSIPPRLKDFIVMRAVVNATYRFLDAK